MQAMLTHSSSLVAYSAKEWRGIHSLLVGGVLPVSFSTFHTHTHIWRMSSVNLETLLGQPATCHTADGEVLFGVLRAMDNDFNCVLGQCEVRLAEGAAAAAEVEPLTFVRGGNTVFVGLNLSSS